MSPFAYSLGHTIGDNCPSQHRAATWDEFVAIFDAPDYLRSTAKGGRYACGPMRAGQPAGKVAVANWRCNELAAPVAWIAFDFDSLDGPTALDTLVGMCRAMFRCLWYHTASSTPQQPRIRIVAPLDREATPAEIAALAAALGPILGPQRDANQDRTSQPLYLPLRGAQVMRCDDASPICVDMWLPAAPLVAPPPPVQALDQEWTDGPCVEWRGPSDDDTLIQRALASKSAAAAFGGRASFADLWTGNGGALMQAYPAEGRMYDASSADAALAAHLAFWTGRDCERIRRLMDRSALARDKWEREDYLRRTVLNAVAHCQDVFVDEAIRRREQIEEAIQIGEGSDSEPSADEITLDLALDRFVLLNDGNFIFDKMRPRSILALDAFHKRYAASKWFPPEESQDEKLQRMLDRRAKPKPIPVTKLWEEHRQRKTVHSITFKAGAKATVLNTEGQDCVNTWVPHDRSLPPGDIAVFLDHVDYLFGDDAPRFLDWLAHIEQRPGELPHQCWLHISKEEGTGRNWLSAVIARLWPGNAAVNFDLAGMFKDGYNGTLSRKIVAVVDEIRDGGGSERWKNADVLKAAITADTRKINPKFGRQSIEYNSCRWLILSNHVEALAVNEADRRFNVVYTEHKPRDSGYYRRLYAAVREPVFIAGVAHFLGTRDLSGFNPFAPPPMTESKALVIAASRSEADEILADVVNHWPADVIQSSMLGELITGQLGGKITPAHRHALSRRGIKEFGKVRIGGITARVSILRNHERWKEVDASLIRTELSRGPQQPAFGPGGARAYLDNLTAV